MNDRRAGSVRVGCLAMVAAVGVMIAMMGEGLNAQPPARNPQRGFVPPRQGPGPARQPNMTPQARQRMQAELRERMQAEFRRRREAERSQGNQPSRGPASARPGMSEPAAADREGVRFFESRIRPVLIEHCYECHSAESDEVGGGLLVDSRAGLLRGGESGPAIVAGRPESSLLLTAIRHGEPKLAMPPEGAGEKLSDEVIADFERWVRMGAPDPRVKKMSPAKTDQETADWWAWKPVEAVEPPAAGGSDRSDPIDRFIAAKLRSQGLEANGTADRATLVRRLAFDLTGLPPSPEDYEKYVTAKEPAPIEELVDGYLGSPRYGERFGRRWLDVARFAESTGQDTNALYPHAWRYRDYVIDAFNSDLPFDRFVLQQLAGDLLPARDDDERARQLIATGFLAIGPKGLNEMNRFQFAVDVADEQIDAFSQAFLGVTIACARCHDHKFDPITHRDYTAIAGIFLSSQTMYGTAGANGARNRGELFELPAGATLADGVSTGELPDVRAMRRQLEEATRRRDEALREAAEARRSGNTPPRGIPVVQLNTRVAMLETQLAAIDDEGRPRRLAMAVVDKEASSGEGASDRPLLRAAMARGDKGAQGDGGPRPQLPGQFVPGQFNPGQFVPGQFGRGRASGPFVLTSIIDSPQLIRGEIDRPGDKIARGLPEFLSKGYGDEIPEDQSGRLQVAQWVASKNNPLTSRVIVNRVWSWLMGQGLVETVDNFGTTSEPPVHRELLDHLAKSLVRDGWSIKRLVRRIVLSDAYARSSEMDDAKEAIDPDNRYWWRGNLRAIEAEGLRDALLVAAGVLDLDRPQGSIISRAGDSVVGGNRLIGLSEDRIVAAEDDFFHRSIYLPQPRQVRPEVLELFDAADNSAVSGARESTLVPTQALYWLNSSRVEGLARLTAQRVIDQSDVPQTGRVAQASSRDETRREEVEQGDELAEGNELAERDPAVIRDRLGRATVLLLGRDPLEGEIEATTAYVSERGAGGDADIDIWTTVCKSLVGSGDFRFLK